MQSLAARHRRDVDTKFTFVEKWLAAERAEINRLAKLEIAPLGIPYEIPVLFTVSLIILVAMFRPSASAATPASIAAGSIFASTALACFFWSVSRVLNRRLETKELRRKRRWSLEQKRLYDPEAVLVDSISSAVADFRFHCAKYAGRYVAIDEGLEPEDEQGMTLYHARLVHASRVLQASIGEFALGFDLQQKRAALLAAHPELVLEEPPCSELAFLVDFYERHPERLSREVCEEQLSFDFEAHELQAVAQDLRTS